DWTGGPFDAVLLDAPCSATGTIRRHPDLPLAKREMDLAPLLALQAAMIDRALAFLRPGGRMVFCTCSLLPEEGEEQVASALGRHPSLRVDPIDGRALPGLAEAWRLADGTLRITPESWAERGGIDGFFIARLIRADAAPSGDDRARQSV
nr:16S rRNA methyltransferase [Paracoccaceae bacterium]